MEQCFSHFFRPRTTETNTLTDHLTRNNPQTLSDRVGLHGSIPLFFHRSDLPTLRWWQFPFDGGIEQHPTACACARANLLATGHCECGPGSQARGVSVPSHVPGGMKKTEGERKPTKTKHPRRLDSHSCNAKNADARCRGRPICKESLQTTYCNVNNKTHKEPWRTSLT